MNLLDIHASAQRKEKEKCETERELRKIKTQEGVQGLRKCLVWPWK